MALFLAGVMALSSAAADDDTALERCVSIDDAEQRLACYDTIAGRSSTEESVAAGPAITNDFGAEQLGTGSPDRKVEKPVSVKVTSCRKDASKRYYFHLENGQVWRQNDDDRLRLKECNFNATIVRDSFGYKLQIEGQKRRTRVKRVQ